MPSKTTHHVPSPQVLVADIVHRVVGLHSPHRLGQRTVNLKGLPFLHVALQPDARGAAERDVVTLEPLLATVEKLALPLRDLEEDFGVVHEQARLLVDLQPRNAGQVRHRGARRV